MLQAFDGAARLLGLDAGIWKILTHPKRQITVSCPVQIDNGEIEVLARVPRVIAEDREFLANSARIVFPTC
jgi:glutamate dehydrogenase/leucine dehydrogenase